MSVSKSFLSAITGVALGLGRIDSIGERVLNYFPEYVHAGLDPRKHGITIRHLLTMRMGIRAESEDGYAVYSHFYTSDNWVRETIEAPLIFHPGEGMAVLGLLYLNLGHDKWFKINNVFDKAVFSTLTAARALVRVHIACLSLYAYLEVARRAFDRFYFRVG